MTFDWQLPIVVAIVGGAVAYLLYTFWPRAADDAGGCGSCSTGCDQDAADPDMKPQAKSILPVEELFKKRT